MQCELVISTDLASEIYGFTLDESTGRPRDCIDLSQITDRIYLGSYEAGAKMYEGLRLFGITHILTVGNDMPPEFLDQFTYKVIELQVNVAIIRFSHNIKDHHRVDISVHFEECFEFIRTALSQDPNNVILIHCFAGVSRSATVTIAYLMQSFCMSYPEACEHVRKARHWIDPNRGFRARLKELAQGLNLYDEAQV